MRAIAAAFSLLSLVGCAPLLAGPPPPAGLAPTVVTARLGQTVRYGHISVTPRSIEDSRCPADATCVHQGTARVVAELTHPEASASGAELTHGQDTWWFGHRVVLLAICPYPLASRPAAPASRHVVLSLSPRTVL